jgi:hypothetical protein
MPFGECRSLAEVIVYDAVLRVRRRHKGDVTMVITVRSTIPDNHDARSASLRTVDVTSQQTPQVSAFKKPIHSTPKSRGTKVSRKTELYLLSEAEYIRTFGY